MSEKHKPAHKIRRPGGLTVTIWKNDGENGPFYSVTATRSYKQGEEWKETTSFHQQDLLTLGKMLDQADTWIANEQAKAKLADQGHDPEQSGYTERETGRRAAGGRGH